MTPLHDIPDCLCWITQDFHPQFSVCLHQCFETAILCIESQRWGLKSTDLMKIHLLIETILVVHFHAVGPSSGSMLLSHATANLIHFILCYLNNLIVPIHLALIFCLMIHPNQLSFLHFRLSYFWLHCHQKGNYHKIDLNIDQDFQFCAKVM